MSSKVNLLYTKFIVSQAETIQALLFQPLIRNRLANDSVIFMDKFVLKFLLQLFLTLVFINHFAHFLCLKFSQIMAQSRAFIN